MKIDKTMNKVENTLTDIARYPVIGTGAGLAKIFLGLGQTFTAMACGTVAVLIQDKSVRKKSWTHMKHGAGNIARRHPRSDTRCPNPPL